MKVTDSQTTYKKCSKKHFWPHLFIIVLICSCTKYADFDQKNNSIILDKIELKSGTEIKWEFGMGSNKTLSKGFKLEGQLPLLPLEAAMWLYEKKGADSWIITIRRRGYSPTDLGYIYVPFLSRGSRGDLMPSKMNKFIVMVYYSAAAPSKRFEMFKCPAFNHRKRIDSVDISYDRSHGKNVWTVETGRNLSVKVSQFSFTPIVLNGGTDLRGDYIYDIALFDSRKKVIMSNTIKASGALTIKRENEVVLSGCDSFEIPKKSD